jgi:hypothetical protein
MKNIIIALCMIPLIFVTMLCLLCFVASTPSVDYIRPSIITMCLLSMLPGFFFAIALIYAGRGMYKMIIAWHEKRLKHIDRIERKKIVKTILNDKIKFVPRKVV